MHINHPNFKHFFKKGMNNKPVIVFEREYYKKPSKEKLEIYHLKKVIVELLDGRMIKHSYEIIGKNPTFTQNNVYEMLKAVRNQLPLSKYICHYWNGAGSYSLSVSIEEVNDETNK